MFLFESMMTGRTKPTQNFVSDDQDNFLVLCLSEQNTIF